MRPARVVGAILRRHFDLERLPPARCATKRGAARMKRVNPAYYELREAGLEGFAAGRRFARRLAEDDRCERVRARTRVHAWATVGHRALCAEFDAAPFEVGPRRTADPKRVTCKSCLGVLCKFPQLHNRMAAAVAARDA